LESYKKAKEQLEKEAKEKKPEPVVVAVKKPVIKKDKSKEAAEIASSIAPPAKDQ
jgi:hypothetical protein